MVHVGTGELRACIGDFTYLIRLSATRGLQEVIMLRFALQISPIFLVGETVSASP
jgi:hypothetical protein